MSLVQKDRDKDHTQWNSCAQKYHGSKIWYKCMHWNIIMIDIYRVHNAAVKWILKK